MMFRQKDSVFGSVEDISAKYSISRADEIHTKTVDIPTPMKGRFRIDDVLEPSRYIYMAFSGIHNSFFIGVNEIQFYNEAGEVIPYVNIAVDGTDVNERDPEGIKPAFPPRGWWAVMGGEHSLVFDFGTTVHVKEIFMWCANSASTPKVIRVTDARLPLELDAPQEEDAYCKERYFQIAGDPIVNIENVSFRRSRGANSKNEVYITLQDVVGILNANSPPNGFDSFMSEDGKSLVVFYTKGGKTRAMNYYFGRNPTATVKLANSVSPKGGVLIDDAANRAMTLEELRVVRAIIVSKCIRKKWKSSSNDELPLRPEDVNLYDLNELLIKPLTKKKNVAFKELFSSGVAGPVYFVSHCWEEHVLDFIQCCEYHAMMHDLEPSVATYWVCAYASRQYELGLLNDLTKSSFNRAMELAKGTLLIIDPKNAVTSRIWVNYELFRTIQTKSTLDIAVFKEGNVSLIADKVLVNEHPYQRNIRESKFPFEEVCDKFFQLQLHKGEASMEIDKIRILNILRGNIKNLDSRAILSRCIKANTKDKNYLDDLAKFAEVDNALRATLAEKALSISLSKDDQTMEDFYGYNLLEILSSDICLTSLAFDGLSALDSVTDEVVHKIIGLISPNIETFTIDVFGCTNLTDAVFIGMNLPDTLIHLDMNFGLSPNITNDAILEFTKIVPSSLKSLKLNLTGFKNSDGSFTPPRFNSHLQALAGAVSTSLESFELTSTLDEDEHGIGIIDLAKCMPMGIKKFKLDLIWTGFKPEHLNVMIGYLPSTLEQLELQFFGGDFIDDDSLKALAAECGKLVNLSSFQLNSCDSGKGGYYCSRDIQSFEHLMSIVKGV